MTRKEFLDAGRDTLNLLYLGLLVAFSPQGAEGESSQAEGEGEGFGRQSEGGRGGGRFWGIPYPKSNLEEPPLTV